jgi:hypothetical protein
MLSKVSEEMRMIATGNSKDTLDTVPTYYDKA